MKKYKYPEPDNNQIFELDHIGKNGAAYFKCGHAVTNLVFEDMIDLDTGYAKWELKTIKNYQMNNKLNKSKGFAASEKSIMVKFGTEEREVTNLLRSGIQHQGIILVANNNKWHEIEILNLGADNSDLQSFKAHVELHNLTLVDLGIEAASTITNHDLKHSDYMDLEKEFPPHSYIDIAKLDAFEKTQGGYSGKFGLRITLKAIKQQNISIDGWIDSIRKKYILKSSETTLLESINYEEVVNTEQPQQAVPLPEQKEDPSVSISIFDSLTPAKITELSILRKEQEQIVKDNPVVIITDKNTYTSAKKTKAILLSASTRINGKNGLFTIAKKALNDFKKSFDVEGDNIEALARTEHDKQAVLITAWDNRILLQQQNRIKQLFEVPFIFDGVNYTIGTLVVFQKEIEDYDEVEWNALIEQGKSIAVVLESAKLEQNKEIEALKETNRLLMEKLEAFMKSVGMSNTEPETESISIGEETVNVTIYEPSTEANTTEGEHVEISVQEAQSIPEQPKLPNPNNKLLNQLYLDNLENIETDTFKKYVEGYEDGLLDAGQEIREILLNPDPKIQKSVAINDLIETWKC